MYILMAIIGSISLYYTIRCIFLLGNSWVYTSMKLLNCDMGKRQRAFYMGSLFMCTIGLGLISWFFIELVKTGLKIILG